MFADHHGDCTAFSSVKATIRTFQHVLQQTDDLLARDVQVQTTHKENRQVQTEVSMDVAMTNDSYDVANLASFLRRVVPDVLLQLDMNLRTHAFDCYGTHSLYDDDDDDDDDDGKLTLLHTLSCDKVGGEEKMSCSALSWNSTGSVIAVSYGVTIHEGWCTHAGGLAVWNVNRRDFSGSKPNFYLESSACLTSVHFHPVKPAIIAGGNRNGEVCVWDVSREDDDFLVSSSPSDESGHGESITSLHWITDGDLNRRHLLVSSGLDGRIIIWKLSDRDPRLQLIKGFIVLAENLPKTLGSKSRRISGEVGVTDLSFCHEDPNLFFAALEGGGLVQCSLDSHLPAGGALARTGNELLSPVVLALLPHQGHLTAIGCSPFERNLIASCGLDGELRFYSVMQPGSPVFTVNHDDPLESLCWSPARPLLVATVTSTGEIVFFSVQQDQRCRIEHRFAADKTSSGFLKLLFNPKDFSLMSTISKGSEAQVFQLGREFLASSSRDTKILNELCKSMQ